MLSNALKLKVLKTLTRLKYAIWKNSLIFLKDEIDKLRIYALNQRSITERTNNLSHTLADLQGKAKNAELERDSLITAMRLLVLESNTDDKKSTSQ